MARIAWIEDDHEKIRSLVKLLDAQGHTILPYKSWQEVKQNIETICRCDAVILDIILPPVNDDPYLGLSILRQLREEHEYQKPIVVCSRVKNPAVLRELEQLGVTQILRKPVRPSELYQAVTEALAESGPDS